MISKNSKQLKWKAVKDNEARLQFPIKGDSGIFCNVGRRHYDQLSNRSDLNLFNPQLPVHPSEKPYYLYRNNSRQDIQQFYNPPQILKREYKNYRKPHHQLEDSLVKEEKDFEDKKNYKSRQELSRQDSSTSSYSPPKSGESYLKIFGPIQSIYDMVHDTRRNKSMQQDQQYNIDKRKERKNSLPYYNLSPAKIVNPTYISSAFEAA